MPISLHENRIEAQSAPAPRPLQAISPSFQGFLAPTSNTTYTPNQFFDVCLPHYSRGVVRLVAYMIRKTLGWCDAQGDPQEERIRVSYQDLVTHAGISREMIRRALDEAVQGHFIRCVQQGLAKASGNSGQTALYELCWEDSPEYVKDIKRFRGFFEAEGNRTDIPNEFFDRIIPDESLAVIKTVGSIIRFSIGFQARRGVRRQHVQLSYSDIQRYARIRSRATLSESLANALRRNYVICLQPGLFDPNAGRASRAAVYALKWADGFGTVIVRKNEPGKAADVQDHRSEIRTGDQSENSTGNGQKNEPEDRSEKRTGIEMKQTNETFKQQAGPVDADLQSSFESLKDYGFDPKTALILAKRYTKASINDQIRWLPLRNPARNALGMIRRAIEENWPDPTASTVNLKSPGALFASHFYAAIAGNEGQPAAEPSVHDIAVADRFLEKLKSAEKSDIDPSHWGRAFGQIFREDFPAAGRNGFSLELALRLRGNGFYLRHQRALKAMRVKTEMAAREKHQALHRAEWTRYLTTEEQRVKKERPEAYACFEAHRADERRRMIESPWAVFPEERLARYDGEGRRVLDFQKFFASEVLDFWTWDARLNPQPFIPTPAPITT